MASQGETESEKDICIELLECYKSYRCLWDTSCPHYTNRDVRNDAYNGMLQIYKKLQRNSTTDMLKKKLDNMRTCYKRELKKVMESTRTGTQDIYVPRLWYFDHMTFLDEKDIFNRSCTDALTDEEDSIDSELATRTFQTPKVKKERHTLKRKQLTDEAETPPSTKNDNWKLIGKAIGFQLKDLTAHQQTIAHKLISDAIFYGKMKKLTEHSCINLSPFVPVTSLSPSPSDQHIS